MAPVARVVKMVAKPGKGEELKAKMLDVAASLTETPGCLHYVIHADPSDADAVWATELWRTQEDVDAALKAAAESQDMSSVLELVERDAGERTDLEPLGGVGAPDGASGSAIVNLGGVEDLAAKFGYGEMGEARFARTDLGAVYSGVSLQTLPSGVRQSFGHSHHVDEEIYVVLSGSGRVALGDETHDVKPRDAIRVAAATPRAFEAGPEGLALLAFGTHHAGDAVTLPGWWPNGAEN